MLNKARGWFGQIAPLRLAGYLLLIVLVYFLFFWRLSSFTPGLAPSEIEARAASLGLHAIYNDPINAPYKFLQYLLLKLAPDNIVSLKLPSAIMACVFGFCFYKLSSSWFGKLVGGFGTLIFISLPLFVISARQASGEIMFFSVIVLLWLFTWFTKKEEKAALAWFTFLGAIGLLLYTPGIIWFLIGSLIFCRKRLLSSTAELSNFVRYSGLALLAVITVPLIISCVAHPSIIKQLLLIPHEWLPFSTILKNTAWAFSALWFKSPSSNLIIDHLPIINVVAIALAVFGVYAMQAAARNKAIWLSILIIFGIIAAGLNNNIAYLALGLPALVLFISGGLRYLYIEWRAIFPRNPVPKTFALILIAAVVTAQVYYGVRYTLIAWPHTAATRSVYVLK